MCSFKSFKWVALASAVFVATAASAQSGEEGPGIDIVPRGKVRSDVAETEHRANIRVHTTLVPIPVAVTDPLSRFVTGLEKGDFRLYEDKVEQEITQLSSEDVPLSVGIVFDTSGSMGTKLGWSRQAVTQFMKTANPDDEFLLIEFSDRANITAGFTSAPEEIQSRLTFTQSKGGTALLDGVYLAMNQMRKAHNARKAILIISDGGDNASRYTEREVKSAVRESDVQIYAIGIFEPNRFAAPYVGGSPWPGLRAANSCLTVVADNPIALFTPLDFAQFVPADNASYHSADVAKKPRLKLQVLIRSGVSTNCVRKGHW